MTRTKFAEAVRGLLTDDQRRQIRDLHDQVQEAYEFGCCAHNEGDDCCVDVLVGERVTVAECTEETRSWDHFTPEQTDSYWIRCTLAGQHDEHKDENTGLTWRAEARP